MNVLTSDWEVTTSNIGNPFDQTNKAVCLAAKFDDGETVCYFDTDALNGNPPFGGLWIFFNAKFDLHWYRRQGYALPQRVWCCQLAEFVLERQAARFPSLEATAVKYGLGHKHDVVKLEYWDKGIDTDQVPHTVLSDYACQDVDLTYQVYLKQVEQFQQRPQLYKLFKLLCMDLLVLQEMEWNGLVYDDVLCEQKELEIDNEIQKIQERLSSVYPHIPINFNSGDQLSAFLYGGSIIEEYKEHVGFYKTGIKAGEPKFQNKERVHTLPQLVKPLPKSELKKEGFYATDEGTLRKLKGPNAKKYVGDLLKLAELEKLNGTYYKGLPKINKEMHWPERKLHGQFNQVVAISGRLSSSKPNQQNFADDMLNVLVSRYV